MKKLVQFLVGLFAVYMILTLAQSPLKKKIVETGLEINTATIAGNFNCDPQALTVALCAIGLAGLFALIMNAGSIFR